MDSNTFVKNKKLKTSKNSDVKQSNNSMANVVLNDIYENKLFKDKFLNTWKCGEEFDYETPENLKEMIVTKKPFNCARLPNLFNDDIFLNDLVEELNELPVANKKNDLFQLKLSDDLKGVESLQIKKLCSVFKNKLKPWMQDITGLRLNDTVSLSCSKYNFTDRLLCHDDMLEDRRIAFILYLVVPWEESNGGSLDLFGIDHHSRPWNIEKRIYPIWNSFAFFEVSPISFHQVSEILSEKKTRLSINGWFHGDPIQCPLSRYVADPKSFIFPTCAKQNEIRSWIFPEFLTKTIKKGLRKSFEKDSYMNLGGLLNPSKYKALARCFLSNKLQWTWIGPPDKKHYEVMHRQDAPKVLQDFLNFLHSESMLIYLSQITGLEFHPSISSREMDDEDDYGGEGELSEEYSSEEELSEDGRRNQPHLPRKNPNNGIFPRTSEANTFDKGWQSDVEKAHLECIKRSEAPNVLPKAEIASEIIRWSHGCYSLMQDGGNMEVEDYILDLRFFFHADVDCNFGGSKHYVAEDDEDELLYIEPESNSPVFVYRDKETHQFTEYVNNIGRCGFYQEVFIQYRGINQSSTPSSPATSSIPSSPETSSMPSSPGTSSMPSSPSMPASPSIPALPSTSTSSS